MFLDNLLAIHIKNTYKHELFQGIPQRRYGFALNYLTLSFYTQIVIPHFHYGQLNTYSAEWKKNTTLL